MGTDNPVKRYEAKRIKTESAVILCFFTSLNLWFSDTLELN